MEYRVLKIDDIDFIKFQNFKRLQKVQKCWRKNDGHWNLIDNPFIEDWDKDDLKELIQYVKKCINTGGYVVAALFENEIVGFATLENKLFGISSKYIQLSLLHVSFEYRGQKIGKKLFLMIIEEAIKRGAEKIYISAHSSEETVAFYKSIGCVEAVDYIKELVEAEPCDFQMEYSL